MSSSGFSFGRPPQRSNSSSLQAAPDLIKLTNLLTSAQSNVDKPQSVSWASNNQTTPFMYVLTVVQEAAPTGVIGDPEWVLNKETPGADQTINLWTKQGTDVSSIANALAQSMWGEAVEKSALASSANLAPVMVAAAGASASPAASASASLPASASASLAASASASLPASASASSAASASASQFELEQAAIAAMEADEPGQSVHQQLSGKLEQVDLLGVLEWLGQSRETGKLSARCESGEADLFFIEGQLVHASSPQLSGNKAKPPNIVLLEAAVWQEGVFNFHSRVTQPVASLNKALPVLIAECTSLRDYRDALSRAGLSLNSVLERANPAITEPEFDAKLRDGMPLYLELQKRVFIALRAPMTLQALLELTQLPKPVWIPVLFGLIVTGLVTISGVMVRVEPVDAPWLNGIDDMIKGAERAMLQPITETVSYATFVMLLRNECARLAFAGTAFCLAVMEIDLRENRLSDQSLRTVSRCLTSAQQEPFNAVAHLAPNIFFLLLPYSSLENAHQLVTDLMSKLAQSAFDPGAGFTGVRVRCGLAHAPTDGTEPLELLSAASRLRRSGIGSGVSTSRPLTTA